MSDKKKRKTTHHDQDTSSVRTTSSSSSAFTSDSEGRTSYKLTAPRLSRSNSPVKYFVSKKSKKSEKSVSGKSTSTATSSGKSVTSGKSSSSGKSTTSGKSSTSVKSISSGISTTSAKSTSSVKSIATDTSEKTLTPVTFTDFSQYQIKNEKTPRANDADKTINTEPSPIKKTESNKSVNFGVSSQTSEKTLTPITFTDFPQYQIKNEKTPRANDADKTINTEPSPIKKTESNKSVNFGVSSQTSDNSYSSSSSAEEEPSAVLIPTPIMKKESETKIQPKRKKGRLKFYSSTSGESTEDKLYRSKRHLYYTVDYSDMNQRFSPKSLAEIYDDEFYSYSLFRETSDLGRGIFFCFLTGFVIAALIFISYGIVLLVEPIAHSIDLIVDFFFNVSTVVETPHPDHTT